jgi:hypothetical protein
MKTNAFFLFFDAAAVRKNAFSLFFVGFLVGFVSPLLRAQDFASYTAIGRGAATTFETDYHALSINPANVGLRRSFRDPAFTVGILEGNVGVFSSAMPRADMLQSLFRPYQTQFSFAEKQEAARTFANKPTALSVNLTWLGAHYSHEKFGGIAFSVRDRVDYFMRLNQQAAEFMFLGQNAPYFDFLLLSDGSQIQNLPDLPESVRELVIEGFVEDQNARTYGQLLNGSEVKMTWFREYNLAYGGRLIDTYNFRLYAGVGAKLLSGIGYIDLASQNEVLTRSTISMSSSFALDFGDDPDVAQSPTFRGFENRSVFSILTVPKSVGNGLGFDFGLSAVIKNKLYLGASLINLGNMNWVGNVATITDGLLFQLQGVGYNNYNFALVSPETFQFAGSASPFQWTGSSGSIRTELPTMLRVGASYEFFKTAQIGVDVVFPQNEAAGNLQENFYALGFDLRLTRNIWISSGANTGGNQGDNINIPFGFRYISRRGLYELGFGTQDFSSFISQLGEGTNLSFAFGSLRVRFL